MLNQDMPRRNFLYTCTGLIAGTTLGAGLGLKTNEVARNSNAQQPNEKAKSSGQQALHQAPKTKQDPEAKSTEAKESENAQTKEDNSNPTTVTAEEAKIVRDTTITGGVGGMLTGYCIDELFHQSAVSSHDIDSRRRN